MRKALALGKGGALGFLCGGAHGWRVVRPLARRVMGGRSSTGWKGSWKVRERACGVAGAYVRDAASPSRDLLIEFLRDLPVPEVH